MLPRTVVLWLLRFGLIGALILHVHAAYTLTVLNRRARPVKYQTPRDYIAANFASRTMRWTGIIVLLFLVWHLADLTWGWVNPDFVRGEVYRNVDASLSRWPVAAALHRRQHRPRHPPVPRGVEPVPVDGVVEPPVQPVAAIPRHRHRHRSWWSATSRSPSPYSPASSRSDRSRHG